VNDAAQLGTTNSVSPAIGPISRRERILREASALFARRGYTATTTREIAQAVEIRQPSLFHHFSSKAEIMKELLDHNLTRPMAFAERLAVADGAAADRLYEYILFDTLYILTSPYNLTGLDTDDVMQAQEFRKWYVQRDRLRRAREMMVVQGIESGEFQDVGSEFATSVLTGVVLSTVVTYSGREIADPVELSSRIATFALRGLLLKPDVLDTISAHFLPLGTTPEQIAHALSTRLTVQP
jgi:AcrR family transcriptional regulator